MSALLDQFVEEARELLEGAGRALLALERNPADEGAINDLFRSVHTLKGTSGLFDLPALTKLVHAGEDLLDCVREGTVPVTGELVDVQLELLDVLRAWTDALGAAGSLPGDALSVSLELCTRLVATKAAASPSEAPAVAAKVASSGVFPWVRSLPEAERTAAYRAASDEHLSIVALEYEPDAGCYFRGEDPLQTARGIPELYALTIELTGPEPVLAEYDPYECRLRFRALTTAPRAELEHLFRYVSDQVTLVEIDPLEAGPALGIAVAGASAAPIVHAGDLIDQLVAEQRKMLMLPSSDPAVVAGRIAAVGRALANIAAAAGAVESVAAIEAATAAAAAAGDPLLLLAAADRNLRAPQPAAPAAGTRPARAGGGGAGLAVAAKTEPAAAAAARDGHQIRTLKVDQAKVDRLMALIGELVVAKNALPFLARRAEHVHGSRELSREIGQRYSVIDRLAQEMQEAVMEVRLLPVSEVFARFPRLVRDVARKLDKQIELVLEGEETQADKNIIELLGDPLIHIIRNAADHGIETPQARIAKGKPPHGTIRLRAMQEGDLVVIEVSDDGRGVDTERVLAKAVDRGIIDADAAARMAPAEAANLIFHPGLSTADTVSDLSGRGVGMDVVQTHIRDAGGSVSVSSVPDAGTTVRLALPLSMAVMRVMTIETAGAVYGVPIDLIAETVRIDTTAICTIKAAEAFMLRDTIVPLVRLRTLLRLPSYYDEREAVLVLRTKGGLVGMIVDRFDEHMDIILKPLEGILTGLRGFAGTALLGDGRVLMVLDLKELL